MKARKKPIETIPVADLGVDVSPRLEVLEVTEPPVRASGILVRLPPSPWNFSRMAHSYLRATTLLCAPTLLVSTFITLQVEDVDTLVDKLKNEAKVI